MKQKLLDIIEKIESTDSIRERNALEESFHELITDIITKLDEIHKKYKTRPLFTGVFKRDYSFKSLVGNEVTVLEKCSYGEDQTFTIDLNDLDFDAYDEKIRKEQLSSIETRIKRSLEQIDNLYNLRNIVENL